MLISIGWYRTVSPRYCCATWVVLHFLIFFLFNRKFLLLRWIWKFLRNNILPFYITFGAVTKFKSFSFFTSNFIARIILIFVIYQCLVMYYRLYIWLYTYFWLYLFWCYYTYYFRNNCYKNVFWLWSQMQISFEKLNFIMLINVSKNIFIWARCIFDSDIEE